MQALRLYRMAASGHCHRVELMLSLLGLPCEPIEVDLFRREHLTPAFLALNPLGQVPVLVDPNPRGQVLSDSNAILVYLVRRYAPDSAWLPTEPVAAAGLQRWFSLAASLLDHGPATARFAALCGRPVSADSLAQGQRLLDFMEGELADGRNWLLPGAAPTLADVAFYGYSAQAPIGGLSLAARPRLRAWLARVEALPGFVPLQDHLGPG